MNLKQLSLHGSLLLALLTNVPQLQALSPADKQEIQTFSLSDDFLKRYVAAVADGKKHQKEDSEIEADPQKSLLALRSIDSMEAKLKQSPEALAAIQRHNITPRQMVLGGLVILSARMTDEMAANPKLSKYVDKSNAPTAANMALYRKHKAEIVKAMNDDEDDKEEKDN